MIKIGAIGCLLSQNALAEIESIYPFFGGSVGYQLSQDNLYNHDPKGAIFGLFAGLRFSPTWSWDFEYQDHQKLKATATDIEVKTWFLQTAIRYDWPFKQDMALYGRLGGAYWDLDKKAPAVDGNDKTGFSPLAELGLSYSLSPTLDMSIGYQYIDRIGTSNTGYYDSHAAILRLSYAFQYKGIEDSVGESFVGEPLAEELLKLEAEPPVSNSPVSHHAFQRTSSNKNCHFAFGKIELNQECQQWLQAYIQTLKKYPQAKARITAHTDSTGSSTHNKNLSQKRAESVAQFFIESGVNSEQLTAVGLGEVAPIASNSTKQGRAQNRRIEVTIFEYDY
ncbi:hypothetical protein BS333_18270 [Vibrio azureus]|nr:hypothetical protein BS333_18270 [Vibrio azureus]